MLLLIPYFCRPFANSGDGDYYKVENYYWVIKIFKT